MDTFTCEFPVYTSAVWSVEWKQATIQFHSIEKTQCLSRLMSPCTFSSHLDEWEVLEMDAGGVWDPA